MDALADVVRGMDALADIVVLRPWRLITTLETDDARMWRTSTATADTRISPLSHRPPQNSMLVGLDEFVSCTVCAQRRSDVWPNIEALLEGPCIQLEVVAVQAMPSNSMMVLEVERNQAFIIVDRIRLGRWVGLLRTGWLWVVVPARRGQRGGVRSGQLRSAPVSSGQLRSGAS